MFFIILATLVSCSDNILDRESFENEWWELDSYSLCFNVHESGDLLIYEDVIRLEGEWTFVEPNSYIVKDDMFDVKNVEGNCWDIFLHSKGMSGTACECTLRYE